MGSSERERHWHDNFRGGIFGSMIPVLLQKIKNTLFLTSNLLHLLGIIFTLLRKYAYPVDSGFDTEFQKNMMSLFFIHSTPNWKGGIK